ncbi:Zn-ribbon domain-containing OB-fold protein [Sphingobium scionense]
MDRRGGGEAQHHPLRRLRPVHPSPREICRHCQSEHVGPHAVAGTGAVDTYTINYQAWAKDMEVPFVIARVRLDDVPGSISPPISSIARSMPSTWMTASASPSRSRTASGSPCSRRSHEHGARSLYYRHRHVGGRRAADPVAAGPDAGRRARGDCRRGPDARPD